MEQKPLVTVLMGSCNPRWDRLRRAVESLRGQTLTQWELVLWDDGSDSQGAMALEQAAALAARFVSQCAERTRRQAYPRREGVDFEPLLGWLARERGL